MSQTTDTAIQNRGTPKKYFLQEIMQLTRYTLPLAIHLVHAVARKKEEKCSNRGHRLRVHARSRVFLVENRARGSFHFDILQLFVEIAYAQLGTFDSLTKTNCLFREFVDVVYTR